LNKLISIIIPAYNEEERIKQSLESTVNYMTEKGYDFEIIVVDDGSTDNTVKTAQEITNGITVLKQEKNMGKGAAVRRGMLAAKGDIRVFSDADFSTPIYEIEKLLEKI